MRKLSGLFALLTALTFVGAIVVSAEERDPLQARVPKDQLSDAKQMKNPVAKTKEKHAVEEDDATK